MFLTQGLNLGLLHCRQILYHLSHQGSHDKYWVGSKVHLGFSVQSYRKKIVQKRLYRKTQMNSVANPILIEYLLDTKYQARYT